MGVNGRISHGIGKGELQKIADGNPEILHAVDIDKKSGEIISVAGRWILLVPVKVFFQNLIGVEIQRCSWKSNPAVLPNLIFAKRGCYGSRKLFHRRVGALFLSFCGRFGRCRIEIGLESVDLFLILAIPFMAFQKVFVACGLLNGDGQIHRIAWADHDGLEFVFAAAGAILRRKGEGCRKAFGGAGIDFEGAAYPLNDFTMGFLPEGNLRQLWFFFN